MGSASTNTICVDVDGTLILWPGKAGRVPRDGQGRMVYDIYTVNHALVKALKRWRERTSGQIVIWTWGGKEHAERAAKWCGIDHAVCIGKPDYVIDDGSLDRIIRQFLSPDAFLQAEA